MNPDFFHNASKKPSVSILGCGWYGLELAKELIHAGYPVKGSTTTVQKKTVLESAGISPYLLNFDAVTEVNEEDFFDADILVICIPPKRSSAELNLYSTKIDKIARAAVAASISHVIFISATSIYGDHNQTINENSAARPATSSGLELLKAEHLLRNNISFTTTILRFSGLIGPGRHPGRFFAGKRDIPNGKAPINLVHLDDCIQITIEIISKALFGETYNITGPDHPEKQLFYTAATKKLGYEPPEFRNELNEWKIISSAKIPDHLHYNYKIKDWMKWLDDNNN